jgi:hypothetical protein
MHLFLHKVEVWVDRAIPPLLAALMIVIVGEIFFADQYELYHKYADWFDGVVISVFAVDLTFKYMRVRNMPTFVKKHWVEIIATIPFFLVFRLVEFFRLSSFFERGQTILHESALVSKVEKEAVVILRETSKARQVSRTARMFVAFRMLSRFPRIAKIIPFYEKPTGKHHPIEKKLSKKRK